MSNKYDDRYDKEVLKSSMRTEDVWNFITGLGVEGKWIDDEKLMFETACHNHPGEGSYKLYYYENTKLFNCYTSCGGFDIFEMIVKIKELEGKEIDLEDAIAIYVGSKEFVFFGEEEETTIDVNSEYIAPKFNYFDISDYRVLKRAKVKDWMEEGISSATQWKYAIKYDPMMGGATFPHFDEYGKLLGIRERILSKEVEEQYGKYRPYLRAGIYYSSPLSFYLYALNFNSANMRREKKTIVFEGEKSVMRMDDEIGDYNNISTASFGMHFSRHQFESVRKYGIEELVFAYDRQFLEVRDSDFFDLLLVYEKIYNRFKEFDIKMTFILDTEKITDYKDSPIDKGNRIFQKLYNERRTYQEIEKEFFNIEDTANRS